MTRKTTQQQFDERLGEYRAQLGKEQDKIEELEQYYNKNVSILESNELEEETKFLTESTHLPKSVTFTADSDSLGELLQAANDAAKTARINNFFIFFVN